MKNITVPDDYRKIAESARIVVYEVKSDDRFIEFICRRYNIKLCLCVDKHHIKGDYMCMCHYGGLDVDDFIHYSAFERRVVIFRDKNCQLSTPYVNFLNIYESFRLNIFECIKSFKSLIIDTIGRGFNILTTLSEGDDFGVLPYGLSENEILMKMELKGLIK